MSDKKSNLAMAYATQKHTRKKSAKDIRASYQECAGCKSSLSPVFLKEGMCNGCRNPDSIVRSVTEDEGKKMAQGGSITSHRGSESGHEKGINKRQDPYIGKGGGSQAGYDARGAKNNARPDEAKRSISNQVSKDYLKDAVTHHKQTLDEMRTMKKPNLYAQGGMVCPGESCAGCESSACYARGISSQDMNTPRQEMISPKEGEDEYGNTVYSQIKYKRMAKGGAVDPGDYGYIFDIQDQIEHPNYYYDRDEAIANRKLYDNDYGTDPMDSNETGDKLSDADEHGRSMFKRIKLKKAQPGDRGNY